MARYRRPHSRGKSFVKKFWHFPGAGAHWVIGYYLYKSRYSGAGSYGGRLREGFIAQSGRYYVKARAVAALRRGRWTKK